MTGPVASIGEQMKRGAETAAAAINEAGGVNGRKIKIVVEDDACDPKQAVAVANLIVGQQIKFVDGHACSGSSIPASDVYADNNVLMMSPASSNPVLTEKGHPTIMRLYRRDDAQGAFIGPWIAEKYKGKKIAILHDKSAYGKGLADRRQGQLNEAGVKEILFEGINPGEKDYSAIVTKLKMLGAEFVYFGGYHTEAGLMLRQAADQGYKLNLMIGDSIATPEFWADLGPGRRGHALHLPDRPAPLAERGQGARAVQGAGFQARRLHAVQLWRCSGDRRGHEARRIGRSQVKVAKALENGQPVETVLGPVKFDGKGDIKDPRYDINHVASRASTRRSRSSERPPGPEARLFGAGVANLPSLGLREAHDHPREALSTSSGFDQSSGISNSAEGELDADALNTACGSQSSIWLTMPSASFGSNQVDFGGMIAPASATAMRSRISVG